LSFDEDGDQIDHKPSMQASATPRRRSQNAGLWVDFATAATATLVVLVAVMSGSMDQSNTTLVVMGFDPDRAQLITSLLLGVLAAAVATLVTGRSRLAAVLGFCAAGLLFGGTLAAETGGALGATGVDGAFDPGGWLLTLVTLVVSGVVSGWAGASLAAAVPHGWPQVREYFPGAVEAWAAREVAAGAF
jgi:hypothetical protein